MEKKVEQFMKSEYDKLLGQDREYIPAEELQQFLEKQADIAQLDKIEELEREKNVAYAEVLGQDREYIPVEELQGLLEKEKNVSRLRSLRDSLAILGKGTVEETKKMR